MNLTDVHKATKVQDNITSLLAVQIFFYVVYVVIFVVGMTGNSLVCYVVYRNKSMYTVTNLFICNLALADLVLSLFSVPFTPVYNFMGQWVFGRVMCHFLPFAQGLSVYVSAFTLMAIALDRYLVIIAPFNIRISVKCCCIIIACIWIAAALLTLPYGIYMDLIENNNNKDYCDENWPTEKSRRVFGFVTSALQFVLPFFIITLSYVRICMKLNERARRGKPGMQSVKNAEIERERARRINRMLITMVVIFVVSWLPLNIYNLVVDFYLPASNWEYLTLVYFICHTSAMGSICYNPFLYAWMNENFRKEFKTVLPFFKTPAANQNPRLRFRSTKINTVVKYNVENECATLQMA